MLSLSLEDPLGLAPNLWGLGRGRGDGGGSLGPGLRALGRVQTSSAVAGELPAGRTPTGRRVRLLPPLASGSPSSDVAEPSMEPEVWLRSCGPCIAKLSLRQ